MNTLKFFGTEMETIELVETTIRLLGYKVTLMKWEYILSDGIAFDIKKPNGKSHKLRFTYSLKEKSDFCKFTML